MKARLMFFTSLLVLTGCNTPESSFAPGDEARETSFNASIWLKIVRKHLGKGVPMTFLAVVVQSHLSKIGQR